MANYKKAKLGKMYKPVKGSKLSPEQAKAFGKRIDWLMDQNGRDVTPEDMLRDAKNPRSPLHKYFEWNNSKAADKWRLEQARYVLRSITIDVVYDNGNTKSTRAFVNVQKEMGDDEERRSVYVSVDDAMSDSDMRGQLLETAIGELDSWKSRYVMLKELALVFAAIEKTKSKLRKR